MSIEGKLAQESFLRQGGAFARVVAKMQELHGDYQYHEYPKMLRLSQGVQAIEIPREDIKGKTWIETVRKEVFDEIVVNSEEEEERVLSGGKTSAQIEQERQELLRRCVGAGIKADPSWSALRLRRELGDKMDAPEPVDEMGSLKQKLAHLEEMAAMKAKIEALEIQLSAKPEDAEEMRRELTSLGVKVDGRWSHARLREELEKATS